jgi:hypothetical protein
MKIINPLIPEPTSSLLQGRNLNAVKENVKVTVEKKQEKEVEESLPEEVKTERLINLLV